MSTSVAENPVRKSRRNPGQFVDLLFVPVVVLILAVYLSISESAFLTRLNLENVLLQASILGIASAGMTIVILVGELDLSVGAGSALVSVVTALIMRDTGSIALGLLVGLGVGITVGALNGLIVTRLEVPSFVATLGALIICQGIALNLTDGGVIAGLPAGADAISNTKILGLQSMIWLMFAVFLVLWLLQRGTVFGVQLFAVGGNRDAARLSGIPVNGVRFVAFALTGLTTAVGGIALMSRFVSGQPNANQTLALEAIAAVVVGGTSLLGGAGSVVRTLWGVLLISVLRNGLDLQGIDDDIKQVVIGLVFIAAASVDFFRRQLMRRSSRDAIVAGSNATLHDGSLPVADGPKT